MQTKLPTRTLGRTGLETTRLGFGCALWRPDKPHWTQKQAQAVWDTALDYGINIFDTSYDYVSSERWIGQTISERYNEFYIATKCGCTDTLPTSNNSEHEWTRANLLSNIEGSLKRLNRNSVDIIQLHNATAEECETGGLIQALSDMRDQGMVRSIGASTTLPDLPILLNWGVFDVMQIPYSALQREHEDWITKAAQQNVGIIIRGGIAQGEHGTNRSSANNWDIFDRASLDELRDVEESRSAFILRYTLTHPYIDTVIVGTTHVSHLKENLNTVKKGPLSDDIYTETKNRLSAAGEHPAPIP